MAIVYIPAVTFGVLLSALRKAYVSDKARAADATLTPHARPPLTDAIVDLRAWCATVV